MKLVYKADSMAAKQVYNGGFKAMKVVYSAGG